MIGLDTNALLRWLAADAMPPEDQPQVEAVARLLAADEESVHISDVVLAETVWTLAKRMGLTREEVGDAVLALIDEPRVRFAQPGAVAEARAAHALGGPGFADHLIGATARLAGCRTTFTFDRAAGRLSDFTPITA